MLTCLQAEDEDEAEETDDAGNESDAEIKSEAIEENDEANESDKHVGFLSSSRGQVIALYVKLLIIISCTPYICRMNCREKVWQVQRDNWGVKSTPKIFFLFYFYM